MKVSDGPNSCRPTTLVLLGPFNSWRLLLLLLLRVAGVVSSRFTCKVDCIDYFYKNVKPNSQILNVFPHVRNNPVKLHSCLPCLLLLGSAITSHAPLSPPLGCVLPLVCRTVAVCSFGASLAHLLAPPTGLPPARISFCFCPWTHLFCCCAYVGHRLSFFPCGHTWVCDKFGFEPPGKTLSHLQENIEQVCSSSRSIVVI